MKETILKQAQSNAHHFSSIDTDLLAKTTKEEVAEAIDYNNLKMDLPYIDKMKFEYSKFQAGVTQFK